MKYQIQEPRLLLLLPEGAQILRVPTNAEKQVPDLVHIYNTYPFPRWSLCVEHSILYRYSEGTNRTGCPQCKPLKDRWSARAYSRREAIRFVLACKAGHLSDVNWGGLFRHRRPGCTPSHLRWRGGGGALRNIRIECPDCEGGENLGAAYQRDWTCPGDFPERGIHGQSCSEMARILQRGAANLHVAEIRTALTIPKLDTALHQALASSQVRPVLLLLDDLTNGAALRASLKKLANQKALPPNVIVEVAKYSDDMLSQAAQDVVASTGSQDPQEALLSEFRELQRAAAHGHPASPPTGPASVPLFEVPLHQVQTISTPGGFRFRITPVTRLRVVMAQIGYSRMGGPVVECAFRHGADLWFPGVELYGEGIFIDLPPDPGCDCASGHPNIPGKHAVAWMNRWRTSGERTSHPVFVWWHSLAHRLIRALSVDSGYSSAALRERVYVRTQESGEATGGVLLYAAQPGGDGTLGGLIALVPNFGRVLRSALKNLDACSNDPLCDETEVRPGKGNGAACYACEFVSETSCEHRNLSLDRHLLMATL